MSLLVWSSLFLCVLYALVTNWSIHVPPGSTLERRLVVLGGYLLLALFCVAGIIGSL